VLRTVLGETMAASRPPLAGFVRAGRTLAGATVAVLLALSATAIVVAEVAAPAPAAALPDGLALTPPMGFNNWNATGCAIDEKLIRDTADLFVTSGLKAAGYTYVNIDDCWAAKERDPATGRLLPHPERFPGGIKALADYVHTRGLKLGIYTSAGTETCARTMPGALDHEEVDAQTFADWEVDYLKYDNCNNQGRPALERYTKMRDAVKKTGRPIVLSICEWGQNKPWEWGADVGHLWRTTGDINDSWTSVVTLLKQNAPLAPYAGPGHWNDPDMLEVGNGGMTDTEYRSHFSLWAIMAAPLLIGADLRKVGKDTFDILLNSEVIAVDQDRLGTQGRVMRNEDGRWVFVKPLAGGDLAVALFNETDESTTIATTAADLGLARQASYRVRDLWQHREFETAGAIAAHVPAHGTAMYRIRADSRGWWRYPPAVDVGVAVPARVAGIPGWITPAGESFTVAATATNRGRQPLVDARLDLAPPPGWTAAPLTATRRAVLRTGATLTARWRVTVPAGAPPADLALGGNFRFHWLGHGVERRASAQDVRVPQPAPTGRSDLGDLAWALARNGYGPVERDLANGGPRAGDGKPLTINGDTYPKGLGTHAPAELVFHLGGRCSALTVDVGIDDERDPRPDPNQGTATFEIWADGTKVADSGLRTWQDGPLPLSAKLAGATYLRLVGTDAGDTNRFDRTDWAAPVLTC
jgi:alpha-galactosidase